MSRFSVKGMDIWTEDDRTLIRGVTVEKEQGRVASQTGREGSGASGGPSFGMELSPLEPGLHQPSTHSNWS